MLNFVLGLIVVVNLDVLIMSLAVVGHDDDERD